MRTSQLSTNPALGLTFPLNRGTVSGTIAA